MFHDIIYLRMECISHLARLKEKRLILNLRNNYKGTAMNSLKQITYNKYN